MIGSTEVFADADALAAGVADWLIARALAAAGVFRVALSGGSTPKRLFALLAQGERARAMPWGKLHVFWGDERYVPRNSPDSNAGEAMRILFDYVGVPAGQLHPMPCGPDPRAAADAYEALLQAEYGAAVLDPARPLFDVNLLGLGEDGHTASLLPGQPVLDERTRWVSVVGQGRPEVRITLTYPALESAGVVVFLVSGEGKRAVLGGLRDGMADVPAARLRPAGEVVWMVDRRAWGESPT